MFSGNIGPWELIIVLVIVLVIFGPKRLPGLGRQLGKGMREFKDSITGNDSDKDAEEERPAVTRATAAEAEAPAAAEARERPEGETRPAGRA
jgi:sec-independent protein translocase protein TatA